jgi:hypothetical protein
VFRVEGRTKLMQRHTRFLGLAFSVGMLMLFPALSEAIVIHVVDSSRNLFFHDWGHPYNVAPFDATNNEFGALGRGAAPEVVSNQIGALNFAGLGDLTLTATGTNAINATITWGPDGQTTPRIFRGAQVYSLIGVWSESFASIVPLGSHFFVGSSATLHVPGGPAAYLWLGFNDGIFDDNNATPGLGSGFVVSVTRLPEPVPEPSSMALLGLGLGAGALRRRFSRDRIAS